MQSSFRGERKIIWKERERERRLCPWHVHREPRPDDDNGGGGTREGEDRKWSAGIKRHSEGDKDGEQVERKKNVCTSKGTDG